MPLTVLSIAYPHAPVRQAAVGGAEQILSDLDHALVENGHRSLVIACEGSETAGTLFPTPCDASSIITEQSRAWGRRQYQHTIDRVLATQGVDVVHMHGIDFHEYRIPAGTPTLVTLHMPLSWYPADVWKRRRHLQFCCVSDSQRRSCPAELNDPLVIRNGVELPAIDLERPRENFALTMGRICPEKNQHAALIAGTLAGTEVRIAGQVYPYQAHTLYYEQEIVPRLHPASPGLLPVQHQMLGPVSAAERLRLLATARCLLHPTLAPETSSLVALEALASGVPVIAYRSGALPEIVQDGVTGYLVDSPEAMAQAIGRVDSISRAACRRAAEQGYAKARMVGEYLRRYAALASEAGEVRRYA